MKNKFALIGLVAVSAMMIGCSSTQCRDKSDCGTACADKAACCGSEKCSTDAGCAEKPCDAEKKACCGTCGGGEHSHGGDSHSHDS